MAIDFTAASHALQGSTIYLALLIPNPNWDLERLSMRLSKSCSDFFLKGKEA